MSDFRMKPAVFPEDTAFAERYPLIPDYMKDVNQWVCIKDGKAINPNGGTEASVGNEDTWASFDDACRYAEKYNCRFVSLGAAPEKAVKRGDYDTDGRITAADAQTVLTKYAEMLSDNETDMTALQEVTADVNGDGRITVTDVMSIVAIIMLKILFIRWQKSQRKKDIFQCFILMPITKPQMPATKK